MKSIYLLVLVCLFASCGFQKSTKPDYSENSNQSTEIDSKMETHEQPNLQISNPEILTLPIIGTFELTDMKIDSTNEYGGGDCWRKVTRYSLPHVGLALDNLNCGEYGYTYTYYLLSPEDFIQVVFTKKFESVIDPENSSYYYVLQEQIIDFNSDPAILMTKIDTVFDYINRVSDKPFESDTLKDHQTIYKDIEMKYHGLWEKELED